MQKNTRRKLRKLRATAEVGRLRTRVDLLARAACFESKVNRATSLWTLFCVRADGVLTAGGRPLKDFGRKELRLIIEAGFVADQPKGQLELLVDLATLQIDDDQRLLV